MYRKRGGAVEACWAHNPEDGGSKPLSANFLNVYIMRKMNKMILIIYGEN